MGYSEFVEWMAFYETEPFGDVRGDIQSAIVAATVVNTNRKKGSKPIKASKFLPDWWKDDSKPEALLAKFRVASAKSTVSTKKPVSTDGNRARNTGSSVSR